jgi:cysteine synthase A
MPPASKVRTTGGRGRLFDSVLDTVGDTPCIRVNNLAPKGVRIYAKAEAFNPAASVKDRLALNIIEAGERNGTLEAWANGGGERRAATLASDWQWSAPRRAIHSS